MARCDVYWGSHGCDLERGHGGPHRCSCADDPDIDPVTKEYRSEPGVFNVGAPPYYGPETRFYGDDVFEGRAVEPLALNPSTGTV